MDANNNLCIITCENFSDPYSKFKGLKNLVRFFELYNIEYKIIYTKRLFDEYAESLYAEFVTNSYTCEMKEFCDFKVNLEKFINKLETFIFKLKTKTFIYSQTVNNEIINYLTSDNKKIKRIEENKK